MTMSNQNNNKYSEQFWDNFNDWISYYRQNIHRFITEYLGINLYFFQKILVYLMDFTGEKKIGTFVFFASRGLGKSWLCSVYCVAKAILYPGIKIVVSSANVRQGKILAEKIRDLAMNCPMLETELKGGLDGIHIVKDGADIQFENNSTIETVVCGPGGKGKRSQILILDESRLMDKEDVNTNLTPFLTGRRNPPFAKNPKYRHYIDEEPNIMISLTSIGYKDEWSYKDFEKYANFIASGDTNYSIVSLPYQFGVESNIITADFIDKQLKEEGTDPRTFRMEMEVIPYGESEHSMFKYEYLKRARRIVAPLIPITDDEFIKYGGDLTKSRFYQKKELNEIRVVSMDIAVSAGSINDNTVFTVFRLMEIDDYYMKEVSYIEAINGVNLDDQIVRLKRLYYDLQCDYAVIDAGGALGINAANLCGQKTHDIMRNVWYPGWRTTNQTEKFDMRVADPNAMPVLYCVQVAGGSASAMQYNMVVRTQIELERGHLLLLMDEDSVLEYMNKKYRYMELKTSNDSSDRALANYMIAPFLNTNKLVDEAIKTQMIRNKNGRWQFNEGAGRKDRIISMLYGIHFIAMLEDDLSYKNKGTNISAYAGGGAVQHRASSVTPFNNNLQKLTGLGFGKR